MFPVKQGGVKINSQGMLVVVEEAPSADEDA